MPDITYRPLFSKKDVQVTLQANVDEAIESVDPQVVTAILEYTQVINASHVPNFRNLRNRHAKLSTTRRYILAVQNCYTLISKSAQTGKYDLVVANLMSYITASLHTQDPIEFLEDLCAKNKRLPILESPYTLYLQNLTSFIHLGRLVALFESLFGRETLSEYIGVFTSSLDISDFDCEYMTPTYLNNTFNFLLRKEGSEEVIRLPKWLNRILSSGEDMSIEILYEANEDNVLYDDTDHTSSLIDDFLIQLSQAIIITEASAKFKRSNSFCGTRAFGSTDVDSSTCLKDYIIKKLI